MSSWAELLKEKGKEQQLVQQWVLAKGKELDQSWVQARAWMTVLEKGKAWGLLWARPMARPWAATRATVSCS